MQTFVAYYWKTTFCPEATFFLKTLDDTIVNFDNLQSFMEGKINDYQDYMQTLKVYGFMMPESSPFRDVGHQW